MASLTGNAATAATKSYEIAVVQVAGLPRVKWGQSLNTYVQVDAEAVPYRTQDAQWTNTGSVRWDGKITLVHLPSSAKITFSVFRDSRSGFEQFKALVGSFEIGLAKLLAQSDHRHDKDIVLSLRKKDETTCRLTVRIREDDAAASSNTIDHPAGASANLTATSPTADFDAAMASEMDGIDMTGVRESLASPSAAAAAGAISTAGDTATSLAQSSLVDSFTSLMDTLSIVVKMGDEIAKIHPWLNFAWNVLTVGFKLVKTQEDREDRIASLIQTMHSTYSIVAGSGHLRDERLKDVLNRILRQTIVCGFFIHRYARDRAYLVKAVAETFSSTDRLVSQYADTFQQLREEYSGRIATHTAVITSRTATTVDAIRFDQVIDKLRPAPMDESKRGVCLPNTRLDAIKLILDWVSSDSEESVMWLHGVTGAGKSTISTTVARMIRELDLLGAFFFFDRDLPQRNASTLIRTVASKLARFDGMFGDRIQHIVEDRPNIADMPLDMQFSKLLSGDALGDLLWSRGPVLMVIDALDESGSAVERENLIQALFSAPLPWFLRLLVVSRFERDILDQFKHFPMRREELGVEAKTVQADLQEFIRSRLLQIREANIEFLPEALQFWPSEHDIQCLATMAAGLFLWAAAACLLIDTSHNPKEMTDELINSNSLDKLTYVYRLYKDSLLLAGNWDNQTFCRDFRDILGTVICAQIPLSCQSVDALLKPRRPSFQVVSRLGSVLRGSREEPISPFQTSFHDYMVQVRDEPWAINVEHSHTLLAHGCIVHLEEKLHENIGKTESPLGSVAYASKFWITHVCLTTNASEDLADLAYQFMHKHMSPWIQALTAMEADDVLVQSLPRLLEWSQRYFPGGRLYNLVNDANHTHVPITPDFPK